MPGKQSSIDSRKKQLIRVLKDNKLQLKWYGDCYTFIMYGKPSLDQVVINELAKMHKKTQRKIKLASQLAKFNITLDETLPSCYRYINQVGCKSLREIVREVEIEHFFKHNTQFDQIMAEDSGLTVAEARDAALHPRKFKMEQKLNNVSS